MTLQLQCWSSAPHCENSHSNVITEERHLLWFKAESIDLEQSNQSCNPATGISHHSMMIAYAIIAVVEQEEEEKRLLFTNGHRFKTHTFQFYETRVKIRRHTTL